MLPANGSGLSLKSVALARSSRPNLKAGSVATGVKPGQIAMFMICW